MYYFHKVTMFFFKKRKKNIYLPHHNIFLCDAYVFTKMKKGESFFLVLPEMKTFKISLNGNCVHIL